MKVPVQAGKCAANDAHPAELISADGANLLIDSLPVMAWTMTPDGVLNFINRQWYDYTGCRRDQLPGITRFSDWVHPQDQVTIYQAATQLAAKDAIEFEFRLRRHDGEYRWCLARAVKVRDSTGKVVQWVGTTSDIEDMRRVADQQKLRDEHLQLALDSADIGIWRIKLPSMELTVDDRTRRHLDLDSNVIVGYNPQEHIHPDDYALSAATQVPNRNNPYVTEHRIKQRDGTYRWQAIQWRVLFEGEGENASPVLITGTSSDITPRKEAEAEAAELAQRYLMALDAAELGTWSYDVEQRLLHMDERARAHLGVDQHTLTFEQYIACIHESDREQMLRNTRQKIRDPSRIGRATREFRVRHPNGELRWLSSQINVTFGEDGNRVVRVIGVTRDITEIKQAEEQVQRLHADLERRVQQRTAELTAANHELESFAYAVSHDLRAPLRAMWGFCDALIEDYGPTLPPEAHEYLQHVINGSRHLAEIIDGLLALSRSTRGTLRRDPVDLSRMADKVLRDLARVEPDRRVTWTIQPELRACGDSRMIDAVLRNLLGNAWKYTANRSDAVIRVYAETRDGEYLFCVEDNGAGFNMEHAEKLFQPFQRLHRQDEFNGLGIGLATVQRIIHRHGGEVSGTGVSNQGALFRFSLPLPDNQVASNAEQERDQ